MVGYQEVQLRSEALEMGRRRNGQTVIRTAPYAVALGLLLACFFLAGCDAKSDDGPAIFPGNPKRGMDLIKQYGCGGCHLIPGITDATGNVGPPLLHVGTRTYIAGFFSNSPENMAQWIQDPQRALPGNAMPRMGVTLQDSRTSLHSSTPRNETAKLLILSGTSMDVSCFRSRASSP
jgi:cytochrome c